MNYWLSLPFATTYRFMKHYPAIKELRRKIIHHALKHNIVIIGNGDELNIENLMANRRIKQKKRSLSPRRLVQRTTKRLKNTPSAAPEAEQPIVQTPLQEAEQPIEQEQTQAPIAPTSAHLPNINGARSVVHTNTLVLNGFVIEVDRNTFMVNATMMCKAAGKKYFEYARHDRGKLYIKALEAKTGIPAFDLIESKPGRNGGTMVHRLVALDLASWLSPEVKLQFHMWNEKLHIENAAMSTQIEELQANAADSASANAIAPPSAHLPNVYGAEIIEYVLKLSNGANFIVPVRRDGYVNVTKICQAAGKRLQHYKDRVDSKHVLDRFVALTGIPANAIFEVFQGGNLANVEQGTFAHPDIAIHIAQWCSADFSIQVSRWVRQLMTTGRVELGNEMNAQQLEDAWRRINEEVQAKASADVKAEQDRSRDLELQLVNIQEEHQLTKAAQEELVAIKVREDLEAAIQYQARATAPTIAFYKEGDNVLYLARIDGTKFKYGQTKNVRRRFDTHGRPGVYPTFEPIGILPCANAVASEDKVRAYVKKNKLGAEYGTQREVILLETVNDLERMLKRMNKCTNLLSTKPANEETKVLLQRIKAEIKAKKIDAGVDVRRMDVDLEMEIKKIETMRMKMIADGKITFDQYLSMNKINIY